jgi:hypothetical protein
MSTATADDFIGLSKFRGQDLAEAKNMIFRLISINGEPFLSYPEENEKRDDRVCVEILDGKIVRAIIS